MIRHSDDVSVVICAYTQDRWGDLLSAVASVLEQSRAAREIIVVVDHNPELFRRARTGISGVIVVENHEPRGLSGARNCGIEAAGGSVVAFLDDDAVAASDWLEEIAAGYVDPRVVGVGGMAAPTWAAGRPRWFPEEFDWVVGCSYRGMPRSSARVRNFLGCNMSFKKELFTAYGGFRTGLGRVGTRPLGCEETEFCIRAIQARPDKILLYKPSARVAHRVPAMRARWRYFLSRCYCEGLSKAHVKRLVDGKDGLASEWQYTLSILPGGVVRGLTDTLLRADPAGISRAAFIGAGLLSTTLGYLAGQLTGRRVCRGIRELTAGAAAGDTFPATPNFSPIHIEEVEIGAPLPALAGSSASEGRHRRVLSLVRLHDSPLGLVDLTRAEEGVDAEAYASEIWRSLGPRIEAHLQADCLAAVTELGAGGIASPSQPNCLAERAAFKSSAPFASVVVATRDRPESLRRCLESLLEMDYPHFEIVVVDSAPSTNASAALLEERFGECQQIRYLRESRPGLAIAHNRALMAINSDIVAFTDDDVIVDALWLLQLVKAFAVSENSACVTGLILPRELETPAQLWVEQYANFNKGFSQRLFDLKDNRPNDPLYPFSAGVFGSGANMAFKTAVLRELGGFDPALGAGSGGRGGDDLAAFFDVVTSGYAIVYEPAAINWHQHRREYTGLRKQIYGYGVGLTAYLTKTLMDRPGHILEFAARVPRGLIYAMDSGSAKNLRKSADYPRELTSAERKGMLYGPIAYLGSRWRARNTKPRFDCPDSAH